MNIQFSPNLQVRPSVRQIAQRKSTSPAICFSAETPFKREANAVTKYIGMVLMGLSIAGVPASVYTGVHAARENLKVPIERQATNVANFTAEAISQDIEDFQKDLYTLAAQHQESLKSDIKESATKFQSDAYNLFMDVKERTKHSIKVSKSMGQLGQFLESLAKEDLDKLGKALSDTTKKPEENIAKFFDELNKLIHERMVSSHLKSEKFHALVETAMNDVSDTVEDIALKTSLGVSTAMTMFVLGFVLFARNRKDG